MQHWTVSTVACDAYRAWVTRGALHLASEAWAATVRSLGAEVLFAWSDSARRGALVPVFRRSGLRAATLGFPVSGPEWDRVPMGELQADAKAVAAAADVHLMRVNLSSREQPPRSAAGVRPDLCISGLQRPSLAASKRLRKDLAFARRAFDRHQLCEAVPDAESVYRLYADTVAAHGGGMRYSRQYFAALIELAAGSTGLAAFSVSSAEGEPLAFATLAVQGQTGYYLHAAASSQGRQMGLSDLLLQRLVDTARSRGCKAVDLMASPWDQPGLVHFKKKWATDGGFAVTYDFATGFMGRCAAQYLRRNASRDHRRASEWAAKMNLVNCGDG